ncbi:hypothetical protein OIU78_023396 [Salix suchowensis]|nr:hypothetical protein OIU78_023396 [Salix suchowensis]
MDMSSRHVMRDMQGHRLVLFRPTEVEQSILEKPCTDECLNCTSISHDGSLIACGFSDSSLKVLLSYLTQHPHAGRW